MKPASPNVANARVNIRNSLAVPVLIYLIMIFLPLGFTVGTLALNGLRLLLLIMIIPLTIKLFSGSYGRLFWTDFFFFSYIIWLMMAMLVNNPDRAVVTFGSQTIEFIGGYVMGRAFIQNREDFISLCRIVILLLCLTFPFLIVESVTGKNFILRTLDKLPLFYSDSGVDVGFGMGQRYGLYRAQGSFQHPILHGLFGGLIFPIAFVSLKGVYATSTRYALSMIVALSAFFALSAGPMLSMALQLILIFWATLFDKVRIRWWLLLGLFVMLYIVVDILSSRTPIRVFLTYATFSAHTAWGRLHIFNYGIENVWANPIFGLGLNDWKRPSWLGVSVDNFWLLNAMRYGIPGFAFLAIGYLAALFQVGMRKFDTDPIMWNLRRGWMFAFVGLTFTLTTVHVWSTLFSFIFFFLGAGMWMITAAPSSQSKESIPSVPNMPKRVSSDYNRENSTSTLSGSTKKLSYSRFPSRKNRK